jgi:hypothetical protein
LTVALSGSRHERQQPDRRALWRLQLRIERDAGYLARQGIYFEEAGQLGLEAAQGHAKGAGFKVALSCPGLPSGPLRPSRLSVEYSGRVTAQCPKPGTSVPPRVPIRLEATAVLPGEFTYTLSAFEGTPRCVSGQSR